jgi:glutamate racemase
MLSKKKILEENLLGILEQKATIKNYQFEYFLEKYTEKLNVCIVISKWLAEHVEQYMPTTEKAFIGMLQYQHNEFVFHHDEINNKVRTIKKESETPNVNLLTFLNDNFPSVSSELNETLKKKETAEINTNILETQIATKKKQKPTRISDEEVRQFLLRSVFNVDIDNLD